MSEKSETEKLLETTTYYVISAFEENGEGYVTIEEATSVEGVYTILEAWYANAGGYVYSDGLERLNDDLDNGNLRIVRGWDMGIRSTIPETIKDLVEWG